MHVQPVPVPLANARPEGSVAVTVMIPLLAALPPFVTVRVNCAPCWPAVKLPTCDFAMVKSGNCVTVTMSVFEVLLLVLLSMQVHATAAVLLTLAGALAATFTFSVIADVPPLPEMTFPLVHDTACPLAMHVQPVPVPLANVRPEDSESVTVMVPLLAALPALVTMRVNCAPCWAWAKLPWCDFAMVKSGNCVTVTMWVFEVLLLVLLSVQVQATVAVLLTVAGASGDTFTFSVMLDVPFTAIGVAASVQVTACPMAMHDHPVPVPIANFS